MLMHANLYVLKHCPHRTKFTPSEKRESKHFTRDPRPVTRDLRRLDTVFTKLSSLGRLLLIHVFKLQVLVLVDEIYKPERSILRCGQVYIN